MNTTDVFSTQNSTAETTEVGKKDLFNDYKQLYIDIEWWIGAISFITLPVFGGFGNILSLIVMQRGSLKEVSTCFYMSMLALADTGVLWTGYFPAWIFNITRGAMNAYGWTDCKLGYFCWYFFRQYSSSLLVMMSVEKCIALYFPFKTRNICTVKTAKWISSIAFIIFFFLNFFWFFVVKQQKVEARATNVACIYEDFFVKYVLVYERIDSVVYSFGPFIIMGLTNIAIVYKFVQAKLASKHDGKHESTNQALSNAAMRGTAILITVTMTFIVLTGPSQVVFSITQYNIHPLLQAFLYLGVALNHSINGLLYCIVGSKFRKELIDTLCCNRRQTLEGRDNWTSKSTQISNINKDMENTLPH